MHTAAIADWFQDHAVPLGMFAGAFVSAVWAVASRNQAIKSPRPGYDHERSRSSQETDREWIETQAKEIRRLRRENTELRTKNAQLREE